MLSPFDLNVCLSLAYGNFSNCFFDFIFPSMLSVLSFYWVNIWMYIYLDTAPSLLISHSCHFYVFEFLKRVLSLNFQVAKCTCSPLCFCIQFFYWLATRFLTPKNYFVFSCINFASPDDLFYFSHLLPFFLFSQMVSDSIVSGLMWWVGFFWSPERLIFKCEAACPQRSQKWPGTLYHFSL